MARRWGDSGAPVVMTVDDAATRGPQPSCATRLEADSCDQLFDRAARWVADMRRRRRAAAEAAMGPAERIALLRRRREAAGNLRRGLARAGRTRNAQGMGRAIAVLDAEIAAIERARPDLAATPSPPAPSAQPQPPAEFVVAERRRLEGALQEASADAQRLRAALGESAREADDLRRALAAAENEIAAASAVMAPDEATRVLEALDVARADAEQLREALQSASIEVASLRESARDAALEAGHLADAVAREAARADAALAAVTERDERLAQANALLRRARADAERAVDIERERADLQERYTQLEAYVDQLQEGLTRAGTLAAEYAALRDRYESVIEDNRTLAAINSRLTAERDRARARAAAQERTLVALGDALEAAEAISAAQRQERAALQRGFEEVAEARGSIAAEIAEALGRVPQYVNTTAVRELRDYARLGETVEALREANRALRRQVDAADRLREAEQQAARLVTALTGRVLPPATLYAPPPIVGAGEESDAED